MPVAASKQSHLLPFVGTKSANYPAQIRVRVRDDPIDLFGSVPFACDVLGPVTFWAVTPDDIASWRCDVGWARFENAGNSKLWDRG